MIKKFDSLRAAAEYLLQRHQCRGCGTVGQYAANEPSDLEDGRHAVRITCLNCEHRMTMQVEMLPVIEYPEQVN